MCVWSVNYFDGVYMARAGLWSGGASASGGAVAMLGGARKLCSRGLTDCELREWKRNKRKGKRIINQRRPLFTVVRTVSYLRHRMMTLNYHRAHGRSHTRHLQVAACSLTHVRSRCDSSSYGFCGFLLTGCDDTTADLKQSTVTSKCNLICVAGQPSDGSFLMI